MGNGTNVSITQPFTSKHASVCMPTSTKSNSSTTAVLVITRCVCNYLQVPDWRYDFIMVVFVLSSC